MPHELWTFCFISALTFPISFSLVATCQATKGFLGSSAGKESACNAGDPSWIPGSGRFPWRMDRLPTPVFLGFPGGSGGKESTCNERDLGLIPGLGTKQQRPLKGLHVGVIMLWNLHLN